MIPKIRLLTGRGEIAIDRDEGFIIVSNLQNNLKNEKDIEAAVKTFRSLVEATAAANSAIFAEFAKNVIII